LRRLLGTERAITRRAGQLGLDPRICWVDTWALERALDQADAARRAAARDPAAWEDLGRWTTRALALYDGDFLAGTAEGDAPWVRATAERLRQRLTRPLGELGRHSEGEGHPEEAARWYERALEIDPGQEEEVWRHLMPLYLRLGRRAEAVALGGVPRVRGWTRGRPPRDEPDPPEAG
jgi:two-component SAPR family response regulator